MALDSTGFKRKRFADLYAEIEAKAKEAFGQQLNTAEWSPMGILLRLIAWFLSLSWQKAEDVYNSAYVNTAEDASLDRLGPFGGVKRIQAQAAKGTIELTGTPGYTVESGFPVSAGQIAFVTTQQAKIGSDGKVKCLVQAVEPGRAGNVAAGTIRTIVKPILNVASVNNPEATSGGREKETNQEFRERFALSSEGRGVATTAAIRAALLKTKGVRAATVIENYTRQEDSAGRPPKSFEAIVLGGEPGDIGNTILSMKPAGIEPYGQESVTVNDIGGYPHEMKFSYAPVIEIFIKYTLNVNNSYPIDGDARLKTEAIRYIGGQDVDGTVYVGLNMGEKVVLSYLNAVAYSVTGINDVKVELSKDGKNWTASNIIIAQQEVPQTNYMQISVVRT